MSKIYTLLAESTEPIFDLGALEMPGGVNALVVQASDGTTNSEYSDEVEYVAEYENFVIDKSTVVAIADSVRDKTGKTGPILTKDIPEEINAIDLGIHPQGYTLINSNGVHDVRPYAQAKVEVPIPAGYIKPSGTVTFTTNGSRDVTPYAYVKVEVPEPSRSVTFTKNGVFDVTDCAIATVDVPQTTTNANLQDDMTITANGTYSPSAGYHGFSQVTVNIPTSGEVSLQSKTITANGTHTPDSGYNGFAAVTVAVPTYAKVMFNSTHVFRDTLDFSMIPTDLTECTFWCACNNSSAGYMGFAFRPSTKVLLGIDASGAPVQLYSNGTWSSSISSKAFTFVNGTQVIPLALKQFFETNAI